MTVLAAPTDIVLSTYVTSFQLISSMLYVMLITTDVSKLTTYIMTQLHT